MQCDGLLYPESLSLSPAPLLPVQPIRAIAMRSTIGGSIRLTLPTKLAVLVRPRSNARGAI